MNLVQESGNLLTEFTGQLIGGPNDGNLVTSSVAEIACEEVMNLYLDGPDNPPHNVGCKGKYVWQEGKNYFKWFLDNTYIVTLTKDDG